MPKDYISRLLLDTRHHSLIGVKDSKIIGGITFRLCEKPVESKFVEVLFELAFVLFLSCCASFSLCG
jgi:hypothetical protein